jgi:tetratricopeptide (TPR) repeat protein
MVSIALSLWLLAGPAWSIHPDRVEVGVAGVHLPGASDAEVEAFTERLADALEATKRFNVVRPDEMARRLQGRQELVLSDFALARSKEWLEEGRVLSGRFLFDQSIPMLQRATQGLSEAVALTGEVGLLADAWLELGLAHAGNGQSDSAMASFEEVAILQPDRLLNPVDHAPKNAALYQEARERVVGRPPAGLRVEAIGEGTFQVELDGKDMGPAPIYVPALPAGRHYVRLLGEGTLRNHGSLVLREGEERLIQVEPQKGTLGNTAESPAGRARQVRALYIALGRYAEIPLLLVAGESTDGVLVLFLHGVESGQFSQAMSLQGTGDPAAMLPLLPALDGMLNEASGLRMDRVSSDVPPLDVNANPVLTTLLLEPVSIETVLLPGQNTGAPRWVIWAGAGALAAGGVAAVGVALNAGEKEPEGGTVVLGPIP